MEDIVKIYSGYEACSRVFKRGEETETIEIAKVMNMEDFIYTKVTVERPLRLKYDNLLEKIEVALANPKLSSADKEKIESVEKAVRKANLKEGLSDSAFFEWLEKNSKLKLTVALIKKLRSVLGTTDETMPKVTANPFDTESGFVPDTDLRDTESIPLKVDIEEYFEREVLKFAPDAWMDREKDKIGCEFPFTKLFYVYKPLRSVEDILGEIMALEKDMDGALKHILEA
jgi:type I restriction enzyme M protein